MRLTALSGPGGAEYPTESLASAPLTVWTRKQTGGFCLQYSLAYGTL